MEGFRERTKQFALRIIRMFNALPKTPLAQTLGKQVLRSGTSVAANLSEATRGRSTSEFIAKLRIVEQELDETSLWLELLVQGHVFKPARLEPLRNECEELLKIVVATIKTTKKPSQ